MDFADDVPRIYFPNPCPGAEQDGYLVGWTIGQNTVIAGIVEYSLLGSSISSSSILTNRAGTPSSSSASTNASSDTPYGQRLQEIITILNTDPIYESLRSYCGTHMHILGKWYSTDKGIKLPNTNKSTRNTSSTTTISSNSIFQLPSFCIPASSSSSTKVSSSSGTGTSNVSSTSVTNENDVRSWITMGWDSTYTDKRIFESTVSSTVALRPHSFSSYLSTKSESTQSNSSSSLHLPKVWSFRYYLLSSRGTVPNNNASSSSSSSSSSPAASQGSSSSSSSSYPCIEATNVHIIFYQPPNILALEHYAAKRNIAPTLHTLGATAVTARIVVTTPSTSSSSASDSLVSVPKLSYDLTLAQLNASMFGYTVIYRRLSLPFSSSSSSSSSTFISTSTDQLKLVSPTWGTRLWRYFMYLPISIFILIRFFGGNLNYLLRCTLPFRIPFWNNSVSLYSVSTLARQIHHKLRDFSHWILLLKQIQDIRWNVHMGIQWYPPEELIIHTNWLEDVAARYIFDLGLGVLAALLLVYTSWAVPLVLSTIHTVGQMLHIDVLRAWIDWLMVLPAGLKLNYNAGRKLGGAVLSVIETWEGVTTFLTPFEPIIVAGIGVFGVGGASLLAALASDVLELATLHLYVLYTAFAALHNRQAGLGGALWRLFRGKKHNILRNRVDSNDYDIAQLLLGTLLFTVVFFLFPTTLVYYVFFSSVWMGILIAHGILWWLITALNNIPVGIIWRILDGVYSLGKYIVHGKNKNTNGIYALISTKRNSNIQHWGYSYTSMGTTTTTTTTTSSSTNIPSSNPCRSPDAVYLSILGMEGKFRSEQTCTRDIVQRHRPGSREYWYGNTEILTNDDNRSSNDELSSSSFPSHSWFILYSHSTPIGTMLASPLGEALSIVSKKYSVGNVLRAVLYGERPTVSETVNKPPPSVVSSTVTTSSSSSTVTSSSTNNTSSVVTKKKEAGITGSVTTGSNTNNSGIASNSSNVLINPSLFGYTGTWKDYTTAINILADRWCYGYDETTTATGILDSSVSKDKKNR